MPQLWLLQCTYSKEKNLTEIIIFNIVAQASLYVQTCDHTNCKYCNMARLNSPLVVSILHLASLALSGGYKPHPDFSTADEVEKRKEL